MQDTTADQSQKPSPARRLSRRIRRSPDGASRPRRRPYAVLAIALATLASAAMPGPASAQSLNSVAVATDVSGGFLVLDVAYASTDIRAPVIQWYGNGGANQKWNFVQLPDGNEHIVNQNSGMCLTTDGVAGDQVYQWPCNNGWQDEWKGSLDKLFAGSDRPLSNPASGLYLDVSHDYGFAGAQIITWYWNGSAGEYFIYYQA